MRIEVISGSPRENSVTHRLALHLEKAINLQDGFEAGLIDLRSDHLPPIQKTYTKVEDAPDEVRPLAKRIFHADGFIIVTPEYNGAYAPAMKNLFDHFPKHPHKPFGIVTASPGALGGIRAAMQLQQLVIALFGIASPYMLVTPAVDKKFDAEGNLLDPSFQKSIDLFITEYTWLANKLFAGK